MLDKLLADAEALRTEVQTDAATSQQKLAAACAAVRAAITGGETTGSPIKDVLCMRVSRLDSTMLAQYEAIDAALKGKVGQLVLVAFDESVRTKHTFTGHGNEYTVMRKGILGVLARDALQRSTDLTKHTLSIPTSMFASLGEYSLTVQQGAISEGSYSFNWGTFVADPNEMPYYRMHEGSCVPNVQVIAGNAEVLAYVEKRAFSLGCLSIDVVLRASLLFHMNIPLTDRIIAAYESTVALDCARLTGLRREAEYVSATLADLRRARLEKQPFMLLDRQTMLNALDAEKFQRTEKELVRRLGEIHTEVVRVFGNGGTSNVGLLLPYFHSHPIIPWARGYMLESEMNK